MSDHKFDDPAEFWDHKFDRSDYRYGTEPNAFIADALPEVVEPGARVLCVGDGEGRNGVWCAEQGYETTSIEPSTVGADKIEALAKERGVDIDVIRDAMPSEAIEAGSFDAVVLVYIHAPEPMRRNIHSASIEALADGGTVVLEGFTPDQRHNDRNSGGPPNPDMMFTQSILRDDFDDLDIQLLSEQVVKLSEGTGHSGKADVIRMIATRPR